MSDSINALIGAQRSASVLDAIAHPPQINPLAGITQGADAARAVMGMRELQARQAWGEALAASTDPDSGRIDYGAATARLAKDPRSPMGFANAATMASPMLNDQLARAHTKVGWLNGSVGALPDDATRDDVMDVIRRGVAGHMIEPTEAADEIKTIPTDPAQMPGYIRQLRQSTASATEQAGLNHGALGMTSAQLNAPYTYKDANGNDVNTTVGGYLTLQGILKSAPAPSTAPRPAATTTTPPAPTGGPPKAAPPTPPPPTAAPLPTAYQPPGGASAAAPVPAPRPLPPVFQAPTTPPSAAAAPPPPIVLPGAPGQSASTGPTPGNSVDAAVAQSRASGKPVIFTAPGGNLLQANPDGSIGTSPKPGRGASLEPPPVPAPQPPSLLARFSPIGSAEAATYNAPSFGTPVPGPGPQLKADVDAYNNAAASVPEATRNITAGEAALEALDMLKATGPGTEWVNNARKFMLAQGIPGAELLDSTSAEQRDIARKNILRFAQSNASHVGTNLGLEVTGESNPNIDTMLQGANRHILVQDIGTARQRLAQTLTAPPGGRGQTEFGDGMADHVRNFTNKTDWHAFSWDLMDDKERGAYLNSIKDNPVAKAKLRRSLEIAQQTGVWSRPPAPAAAPTPAAPAPSLPAPPSTPPNPLQQ